MQVEFGTQPPASPIVTFGKGHANTDTVLQFGIARSGTSCLAAVIDALGISMDESGDGHFERNSVHQCFYETDLVKRDVSLREKLKGIGQKHKRWGMKCPPHFVYYETLLRLASNPMLVFMTRDITAVWSRRLSIAETDDEAWKGTWQDSLKLLEIIAHARSISLPCVLVSFEKLRYRTQDTVRALSIALNVPYKQHAEAVVNKQSGYLVQC